MVQKKSKKNTPKETDSEIVETCQKAKEGENCHWIIDPPNGPVSTGTCKRCGETKEFKNSVEFSSENEERKSIKSGLLFSSPSLNLTLSNKNKVPLG